MNCCVGCCRLQVTKRSSAKVQARRSSVKTFIKVVNYNHIMPTRYTLDVDLKGVVTPETSDDSSKKTDANKVGRVAASGVNTGSWMWPWLMQERKTRICV